MPPPTYQLEGVSIYQADCLGILAGMAAGSVSAVITDPPYGIGEARGKNKSRSKLAVARDYGTADWDDSPCSPEQLAEMRRVSRWQIVFGGNYFALPPARCWLVWDKLNGESDFADCELAWTNLPKAVRRVQHRWNGMIRDGREERFHPTQKPLAVMRWCIRHLPTDCDLILDPFAGSGTTGVAAVLEGRRAILIEKDPAYAAICRRRVAEALADGPGHLTTGLQPAAVADIFAGVPA